MTSNTGPENIPPQPAVHIGHPHEFKTKFHPRSCRETLLQTFEEFGVASEALKAPPADEKPWHPFRSRGDFEFSEIALEAALNQGQVNKLLSLIMRIAQGDTHITLKNEADLRMALDNAAAELTPFTKHDIKVPYKKEQRVFGVYARPIWDWALDLLDNPLLAPHFIWDANMATSITSRLPADLNAAPLCFILYADKTKLSTHGTVKGYPVMVHCANLPVDIRNGEGIGGGRVVGWLPIIEEKASEHGKPGFINFKCVVWHEAFVKILLNLEQYSKTGYLYMCYDKIMRWLFPVILILSADYKEQCMMSLICSVQCKCPCPVCLIPVNELSDLSKTFAIRTAKDAQDALAVYKRSKTQGKELLKSLGLRAVENVLWLVNHSDPHDALSLDQLHAVHAGLGGKCLLDELKTILSNLGHEGMELQAFYVALNALDRRSCLEGYRLLHVICSYLELDSLVRLNVHTERTIAMIENELLVFGAALKDYVDYVTDTSSMEGLKQDWNFPKVHLWKHAPRDIRMKGVARNYSTRPNKKLHGPLKSTYLLRSNGKDIAKQVLRVDHHKFAALLLQGRLGTLDEQRRLEALGDSALDEEDNDHTITFDGHVKLGSPQCHVTFQGSHKKFGDFINTSLPTYGYKLMRWIVIPVDFQIAINHENSADWKQSTDHLRSNPSFHGHPHFDCALIQLTAERAVFVRLILMFKCELPDIGAFQFALVQPYTTGVVGGSHRIDQDLRLTRVKAVPRADSIIILLKSFIQGALLFPDPAHQGKFLVVNHVDSDMVLCMKSWVH
ncbi:uncharacterized protein EDB91DRAFT_1236667 [Suillus paluster]|uniref:uncharacterized protein n=1 Tax=Suillus paluster TaxID=48578 RepID=UPI001B875B7C|nr:uncharacterized protein EDB91DRAFT_1236667 [Suillus paluster]KAG1743670.1 hypothetical protein EDB91DRAFT_1236667 [Suillus paluster]